MVLVQMEWWKGCWGLANASQVIVPVVVVAVIEPEPGPEPGFEPGPEPGPDSLLYP